MNQSMYRSPPRSTNSSTPLLHRILWPGKTEANVSTDIPFIYLTELCLFSAPTSAQAVWNRVLLYSKAVVEQHQQVPTYDVLVDRYRQ